MLPPGRAAPVQARSSCLGRMRRDQVRSKVDAPELRPSIPQVDAQVREGEMTCLSR